MRKNKQPFYKEFMTRRRPTPPRCVCSNALHRYLGIISPSLRWIVAAGDKGKEAARELAEFEKETARYLCFKRKLNRQQWQKLYRQYRKERREHEKL